MFQRTFAYLTTLMLLALLVGSPVHAQESPPMSKGEATDSSPELPSFKGFLRFRNDSQLFLHVRRVGYRSIEVQTPGANQWLPMDLDRLARGERSRVLRKTLLDEEVAPPSVSGIQVTLESGEVIEGLTEGPNPARASQKQNSGTEGRSGEDESTDAETGSSIESFVVLTANQGRRELSMSLVKKMEEISVNPIKMVGAQELYKIERRKRTAKDPWAHWELGKLCMKTELFQQAAGHFEQAAKLDSSFQKPSQLRIDILRNRGRVNEAAGEAETTQSGGENNASGGGFGE